MKWSPWLSIVCCTALLAFSSGCLIHPAHDERGAEEREAAGGGVRIAAGEKHLRRQGGRSQNQSESEFSNPQVVAVPFLLWWSSTDVVSDNGIYNDQLAICDTNGDGVITLDEATIYAAKVDEQIAKHEAEKAKNNAQLANESAECAESCRAPNDMRRRHCIPPSPSPSNSRSNAVAASAAAAGELSVKHKGAAMSNMDEPVESPAADIRGRVFCRQLTAESLATLLLRLLGVYFVAFGIIGGVREVISIILAANRMNLELALTREWDYLLRPIMELSIGFYFLLGGQWVFEKLLTPFVHAPEKRLLKSRMADTESDAMRD